ncbi:MAG: hypothetical protein ABIP78_02610 [Pyrinomonadaceae bacterium]
MIQTRSIICLFCLVSLSAGQTSAQMKAPLNPAVDPFTIKRGSTFSASGGSPAARSNRSETIEKPSRIAADIREATAIIASNQIDGRAVNTAELTKSALGGMLRVLDPHSNFYAAAEWKDLLDEQRSGYTGIGATIANFERSGITDTYILSTFPGSPATSFWR